MKRLSIKLRVTLWYTALMVLLSGVCLGFVFFMGSRSALLARQELMTSMVEGSVRELQPENGGLEIDKDLSPFRDGVYLSLYDGAGVPLYGFVPREFDNSAAFSDRQMRTLSSGGRRWYLYDACFAVEGYGDVWVRSISAASDTDTTLVALQRLALIVLPFFVVLAAVTGYLITRRAFAPVRRITDTAREIGAGNDLSRRIALENGRDEIYTLAAEFDRMFARLEEAFAREQQFTNDASHELRTPTAVIISQCEYALAHATTLDEAQQALQGVLAQAEKMAGMLSQLLMLARADRGTQVLTLETVDLSQLAHMAAELQAEHAAGRQITVETQIEPDVLAQGDETMLMRLLVNLADNGIKYGKPGGRLRIALRREDGWAVASVEDDGIGIAPAHMEHIWQRFWQADPARSGGGAGLGLAMVRWIAQAHGGTIEAASQPGAGSVFTFRLPCL